jgi:ribonuclease BN (tRNA processing enzyme)
MEVVFLGVGEACDQDHGNTSLLIRTSSSCILMDCGFSVAHVVFSELKSAHELDAVWISHFHGDHFFSLPLLMLRLWEGRRDKPLDILGPPGIEDVVVQSVRLAYPNFWDKFSFPVRFHALKPEKSFQHLGWEWKTVWTGHSQPNLGLRLDGPGSSVYYSGDGRPGEKTWELVQGCSLMVHEGFQVDIAVQGHGTVQEAIDMAEASGVKRLALVHMQRDERKKHEARVRSMLEAMSGVHGFLPQSGQRVQL